MKTAATLHHVSSLLLVGRLTGKPLHIGAIPVQPQLVVWRQIHKAQRVGEDPLPYPSFSSLFHWGNFMSCPDLLLNINNLNYILWKQPCSAAEAFCSIPYPAGVPMFPVSYLWYWGLSQLFSVPKPSVGQVSSLVAFFWQFLFFFEWQVPWGHLKRMRLCRKMDLKKNEIV